MAATGSQVLSAEARFAGCKLDLRSGELTGGGRKMRLQEQSFRLLKILLERAGEVVTREELQRQLWPADTFVDFDHGLNKAVAKLRDILDTPEAESSLIETLPRRGYRFTMAVEWVAPPSEQSGIERLSPPHRSKLIYRFSLSALAIAVLLLSARFIVPHQATQSAAQTPLIHSVAVLPLANLSGDKSEDYFADGMTDEIITMLAKNTSLRVVSQTSVMRYKGVSRPMHDIAHELGADGILEGSISRSGNRIHLTVQLVQGESDAHLWAESYDRDAGDVLLLLTELSQTIAREVKIATSPQVKAQKKINPEAYNLYLRARLLWFAGDYGRAHDLYEKVIQLQPDYAAAWSGLSDSYAGLALGGTLPGSELREKAEATARKAVTLDDSMAEAHLSMAAAYYFLQWNWKDAEAESLRAIQLNPKFSEAHHLRSYILHTLNRPEEALQEEKIASELDPELRPWALARAYLHLRRYNEAVKELSARIQDHPHGLWAHWMLADAYHFLGKDEEALQQYIEVYRSDNDEDAAQAVQRQFQRGGARAVALFRLKRWKTTVGRGSYDPFELAKMYGRAGEKEQTLKALELAYSLQSGGIPWIQMEPDFDFLHSEPRYQKIVEKMRLPLAD